MIRLAGCALLIVLLAFGCSDPPPERSYDGTWVMNLGQRVFMVLTLERKNGELTGFLTRPEHLATGDGRTYSEISGAAKPRRLVKAEMHSTSMQLAFENPQGPAEPDEFELTLVGDHEATLKVLDIPINIVMPFTRHSTGDRPAVASDWDAQASYSVTSQPDVPSSEMARIYQEDQAAREGDFTKITEAQLEAMSKGDVERRKQTRALLDAGKIQTGADYRKAAFVFQHGDTPSDYLLAHTLALVALKKGDTSASWIAAATLDRYLTAINKPQIYGSQFSGSGEQKQTDPDVVSNALRRELGVPAVTPPGAPTNTATGSGAGR